MITHPAKPTPLSDFEIFQAEGKTLVAFSRGGPGSVQEPLILAAEALSQKARDFSATRPNDAVMMLEAHQAVLALQ